MSVQILRQSVIMEGSVVRLETVAFKPRRSGSRSEFTAQAIRVNFHDVLQLSDSPALVPQVENKDILSVVVALFDVSFSEMDPEEIYDIVSSPEAQAIVLLRHPTDVLEEYKSRESKGVRPSHAPPPAQSKDSVPDVGRFSEVFSDSDSEDSRDSTDSTDEAEDSAESTDKRLEWETFSSDVEEFLSKVRERRAVRHSWKQEQEILPTAMGAESLIVGAAVYRLRRLETAEKVLQLSLLATRRCYRNCGVGRYIVELLKTPALCGPYEVFLAHVEHTAVNFFTNCGLSDDTLLNEKFREVKDEWTNTTLMSYLPPFSTELQYHSPLPHAELDSNSPGFSLNLLEMELEVNMMKKKALLAYQQQAVCVMRLVQEVNTLREQLSQQMREVKSLKIELELEKKRRNRAEQQMLEYKLTTMEQLTERQLHVTDEQDYMEADDSWVESV
ncbi:hypothetical protein AGOR_G00169490 [Albula goreensis]|uniref:N-acetyltransferase domain-containing protein n=1 Tax=Albula goreensis TaxID=1534307 RepID=A0A8T3D122_9TELE|nr:hypothetical protein AGOR_G00169490 [Albula goreensis]